MEEATVEVFQSPAKGNKWVALCKGVWGIDESRETAISKLKSKLAKMDATKAEPVLNPQLAFVRKHAHQAHQQVLLTQQEELKREEQQKKRGGSKGKVRQVTFESHHGKHPAYYAELVEFIRQTKKEYPQKTGKDGHPQGWNPGRDDVFSAWNFKRMASGQGKVSMSNDLKTQYIRAIEKGEPDLVGLFRGKKHPGKTIREGIIHSLTIKGGVDFACLLTEIGCSNDSLFDPLKRLVDKGIVIKKARHKNSSLYYLVAEEGTTT